MGVSLLMYTHLDSSPLNERHFFTKERSSFRLLNLRFQEITKAQVILPSTFDQTMNDSQAGTKCWRNEAANTGNYPLESKIGLTERGWIH